MYYLTVLYVKGENPDALTFTSFEEAVASFNAQVWLSMCTPLSSGEYGCVVTLDAGNDKLLKSFGITKDRVVTCANYP